MMSDTFNERVRLIRFRRKREHSSFWQELKVIPRWLVRAVLTLYVLALIIGISVNISQMNSGGPSFPPEMQNQPLLASLAMAGVITAGALAFSIWLFMLGYVYSDAKRRGMSPGLWTVLVLILSPAYGFIGLIIYLLVREPLPYTCPQCSASVSARFNFCPNCKCNLHPACPNCQREVADSDKFCPYCAVELTHAAAPGQPAITGV
jgi:hypothetical protein